MPMNGVNIAPKKEKKPRGGKVTLDTNSPRGLNEKQVEHNRQENTNAKIRDQRENGEDSPTLSTLGGVRALAWNLESLFEKITLPGVCEFIRTFDIIALAETFTLPNFDFSVKFDDYIPVHWSAERFSTLGRPSGGLAVLFSKKLAPFIEIIKTNISHIICLKIARTLFNSTKDLLYVCCYVHPPNSIFYSNKEYDNTMEMLEQFISEEQAKDDNIDVMINGDLNARLGDWCYIQDASSSDIAEEEIIFKRTAQDNQMNPNGKRLIELCHSLNLTPLNGLAEKSFENKFTFISRRGNSTIDHFLCSPEFLPFVVDYRTINRMESQHLPIMIKMESTSDSNTQKTPQGDIKKTGGMKRKPKNVKTF